MASAAEWLLEDAGRITEDNHVEFLVDGQSYFGLLNSKLSLISSTLDEVYIAGWRTTSDQRLQPMQPSSSIGRWVKTLLVNRRTVRAMIYGTAVQGTLGTHRIQLPAFPSMDNVDFVTLVNQAGGEAFLDARVAPYGSQHQKFVIVRSNANGDCAFVGGIDITLDRFDNASHSSPAGRQTEAPVEIKVPVTLTGWDQPTSWRTLFSVETSMPGWHDIQVLVEGHAVGDIWKCFVARWNDPTPPNLLSRPRAIQGSYSGKLGRTGTHHVQVLQTIPCGNVFGGMAGGEQSIARAMEKAIRTSKRFIYIEDQYFWPSPVTRALADAAARGVKIVVLFSRDYDLPVLGYVHSLMRAETLGAIAAAAPGNVHAFYLQRPRDRKQIYVHSKLMICDDVFALVGSANLNHRSLTNDTELHLGIFDNDIRTAPMGGAPADVGNSIHETRKQLWAEHLDMGEADLADAINAIGEWPTPGNSRGNVTAPAPAPAPAPSITAADVERVRAEIVQLVELLKQDSRFVALAPLILGPIPVAAGLVGTIAAVRALPDPIGWAKQFMNPLLQC